MVPRPEPPDEILEWANDVLDRERDGVLEGREGIEPDGKLSKLLEGALRDHDVEVNEPEVSEDDQQTQVVTDDDDESDADAGSQTELVPGEGDEEEDTPVNDDLSGFLDGDALDSGEESDADNETTQDEDEDSEDDFSGFVANIDEENQ
jgi:hypothetical protein